MIENIRAQLDRWFDESPMFDETWADFVPESGSRLWNPLDKTDKVLSRFFKVTVEQRPEESETAERGTNRPRLVSVLSGRDRFQSRIPQFR